MAKKQGSRNRGSDSGSGSDSASGGSAQQAAPANSDVQEALTRRDQFSADVLQELGDWETITAQMDAGVGIAFAHAGAAHAMQDAADPAGYFREALNAQGALADAESHAGLLIEEVGWMRSDGDDERYKDSPYLESVLEEATTAQKSSHGRRDEMAKLLTPHSRGGVAIEGIAVPDYDSGLDMADAIGAVSEGNRALLSIATMGREIGDGAAGVEGPGVLQVANEFTMGPLAIFDPLSPEGQYVYEAFKSSGASEAVKQRVAWMTGDVDEDLGWMGMIMDTARGFAEMDQETGDQYGMNTSDDQSVDLQMDAGGTDMGDGGMEVEEGGICEGGAIDHTLEERQIAGDDRAAIGSGGKNYGRDVNKGLHDEDGNGGSLQGGGGYNTVSGVYGTTGMEMQQVDDDGNTSSQSVKATFAQDGSMGGQFETGQMDEAGENGQSLSGGGHYNATEQSVAGNAKMSRTEDGMEESIAVNGKVQMNDTTTAVAAGVEIGSGPASFGMKGGYTKVIEQPVYVNGRYVVSWSVTKEGSVKGGLSKATKGKGAKAGGSIGVSGHSVKKGTRIFKTAEAAKKFYEEGDLGNVGLPSGAEEARAMAEGETASTDSGSGASIEGEAGVGGVSIKGGVRGEDSTFANETRGEQGIMIVEVGERHMDGKGGGFSGHAVGVGADNEKRSMASETAEFDLDTPEGEAAYNEYKQTGKLPTNGRGYKITRTDSGRSNKTTLNLEIAGISVSDASTVSHSETVTEDGKIERDGGKRDQGVSIPLLGSYSKSNSLNMVEVDDDNQFFSAESVVKGSDADDVAAGLADVTRGHENTAADGDSKGMYTISSTFSEKQMEYAIDRIKNNPDGFWAGTGLGQSTYKYQRTLKSKLIKANGDQDAERAALARFVADAGSDGLAHLRHASGGGGSTFYVELDGDEYLTGLEGHMQQEQRIVDWDARVEAGERGLGIAGEIQEDILYNRRRMEDLPEYDELPPQMLARELERSGNFLEMLTGLWSETLQTGYEDDEAKQSVGADPESRMVEEAQARMTKARKDLGRVDDEAYGAKAIMERGEFVAWGVKAPKKMWGHDKARFKSAHDQYELGDDFKSAGNRCEEELDRMVFGYEGDTQKSVALMTKAAFSYARAARSFAKAVNTWDSIRTDNAHHEINRVWNFRYRVNRED